MKKLLIILLLVTPSIANAKSDKITKSPKALSYEEQIKRDCKNIHKIEEIPEKEALKCLKAVVFRNYQQIKINTQEIDDIYILINR